MAVAIGTVALLVIWLFFYLQRPQSRSRGRKKIDTTDHAKARSRWHGKRLIAACDSVLRARHPAASYRLRFQGARSASYPAA
jgi:hypothetical protein